MEGTYWRVFTGHLKAEVQKIDMHPPLPSPLAISPQEGAEISTQVKINDKPEGSWDMLSWQCIVAHSFSLSLFS